MSSFFDEFTEVLRKAGGTERRQLLERMPQARRVTLGGRLASAIYDAINEAPATIERNMDLIEPPKDGFIWIEMDGYARRTPSQRAAEPSSDGADRVAYLVMRHESDPNVLVCAIARKTPDRIGGASYLMPAMCAVSLPELAEFAGTSRRYFDRDRNRSVRRLTMMVRAYTPPGIEAEIRDIGKASKGFDGEKSLLAARAEAAPEGAFMIASLLALSAANVRQGSGEDSADVRDISRPGLWSFAGLFAARSPKVGFLRCGQALQLIAREITPASPRVAA